MRKFVAFSLAGILSLSMIGCGEAAAEPAESTTEAVVESAAEAAGDAAAEAAETETAVETETAAETEAAADTASMGAITEEMSAEDVLAIICPESTHEARDISGCDTFTQIVDTLEEKNGYANVVLGETDVLLVADAIAPAIGAEAGTYGSDSSEIYYYADTIPTYLGYVTANGMAYPMAVADGCLFVADSTSVLKYTVADGALTLVEAFYTDAATKTKYYYGGANGENGIVEDDLKMASLMSQYSEAEVVSFFKGK
ncbi:MAG: hypothetical protein K6G23_06075 [Lachnospiraceae bacterium]|nr:hypothetical protein [Lachnospiraceae bacterium]